MNTPPLSQGQSSSLRDRLTAVFATLTAAGLSRAKQENTIFGIVERELASEPFDNAAFWKRKETAAKSTYKKWRKYDPSFVTALEEARRVTREWRADEAVSAVEEALIQLQLATPDFVDKIIKVAAGGSNDFAILQAAFGGLDRASKTTAPKTQDVEIQGLGAALDKIYNHNIDDRPSAAEPDAA